MSYPTHHCKHCQLMRCYVENVACKECGGDAGEGAAYEARYERGRVEAQKHISNNDAWHVRAWGPHGRAYRRGAGYR